MKIIYLEQNQIPLIDKDTFIKNTKLEEIRMRSNEIASIEEGSFDTITNIDYMDLQNNQLISVGTYKARRIDLQFNKLKFLYVSEETLEINAQNNFIEKINCTQKEMLVKRLEVNYLA